MADMTNVEKEPEVKTYTEEEVRKNFVPRAQHEKLIRAFNRLLDEYNELHLQELLNTKEE